MKEFIIEILIWLSIWIVSSWLLSLTTLAQFTQGAFTAIVTVVFTRALTNTQ